MPYKAQARFKKALDHLQAQLVLAAQQAAALAFLALKEQAVMLEQAQADRERVSGLALVRAADRGRVLYRLALMAVLV
jgi:hypothetical protein